mgnify:CR=1 FL=1
MVDVWVRFGDFATLCVRFHVSPDTLVLVAAVAASCTTGLMMQVLSVLLKKLQEKRQIVIDKPEREVILGDAFEIKVRC